MTNDEVNQLIGLAIGQSSLERREVRRAIVVERDRFAIDDAVGQILARFRDGRELVRPVQPLARAQHCSTVFDAKLQSRLRREAPKEFDAAVQRVRERQPPRTELERAVFANVQTGYAPLAEALRRRLTAQFAPSNRQLRSMVTFSLDDWL